MEFDKSKVYTALNANELKIGSKVFAANSIDMLKRKVLDENDALEVRKIREEDYERRFELNVKGAYPLVYLISEPEETWIVYVCRRKDDEPYLTACRNDRWETAQKDYGAKTKLFEGTEDECETWYTSRRHFTDIIAAWEDGKKVQLFYNDKWIRANDTPDWNPKYQYRIKPEGLKWTDLKIGDIVHSINTDTSDIDIEAMIIAIDKDSATGFHVMIANDWVTDERLAKNWKKVE